MRRRVGLPHAELVLRRLGVTRPSDIDLDTIAWSCGAEVVYRPLEGAEAHIQGCGERAVITVNKNSSPERKRYSIAHELGHWHHHRGQQLFCRGDEASTWRRKTTDPERTADAYAADLLMPIFLFADEAQRIKTADLETVRGLAHPFCTSLTAATIRLVERGPFPTAVAFYDEGGQWKWARQAISILDFNIRLPPRLHYDSVAFTTLHGNQPATRARNTKANAWLFHERYAQWGIMESAYPIKNGVLVLLWFRDSRLLDELARYSIS